MSMILTLTSCAILAAISISGTAMMAIAIDSDEKQEMIDRGLETQFMDGGILLDALQGMDCHFEQAGENEIRVKTSAGDMVYRRENAAEAFRLYLGEIRDADELVRNIRSFEVDYQRNVQAYTYAHIRDHLPKGMTLAEETVDEDDAVVLTINVE